MRRHINIVLWIDYEPVVENGNWGDFYKKDVWASNLKQGFGQKSIDMGHNLLSISEKLSIPLTWGIFSCVQFFDWFPMLPDLLSRIESKGDGITIHPHWIEWDKDSWHNSRRPTEYQVMQSLAPMSLLSKYKTFTSLIRSGWNTQFTDMNIPLSSIYRGQHILGIGDVRKTDRDYWFDEKFLILPYDSDSMDDCEKKYKDGFTKVLKRYSQRIYHFWLHIHEISPELFADLIMWTKNECGKNDIDCEFVTVKDLHHKLWKQDMVVQ